MGPGKSVSGDILERKILSGRKDPPPHPVICPINEHEEDVLDRIFKEFGLCNARALSGWRLYFDPPAKRSPGLVSALNRRVKSYGLEADFLDENEKNIYVSNIDGPGREILVKYKEKYLEKRRSLPARRLA